jgi:hypothetical protein
MKGLRQRSMFLRNVHTVYGPFFFREDTVTGTSYMKMLDKLFPRPQEDEPENFIMQKDGAPPHFRLDVRRWLNAFFPIDGSGGVLMNA